MKSGSQYWPKMASMSLPLPIVSSVSTLRRLQASRSCSSLWPVMSYPVFSRMASVIVTRRNGALNEICRPSMVSSVVPFTTVEMRSSSCSVKSIIQR